MWSGRRSLSLTDAAIAFVDRHRDEPFHLFVNYYDPHAPLLPPERDRHRFWDGDPPARPTPAYQLALYDAEIFAMDRELPYLLDQARSGGLTLSWVCLRDCMVAETPIESFQALHDVGRPLAKLTDPDADSELAAIGAAIKKLVVGPPGR